MNGLKRLKKRLKELLKIPNHSQSVKVFKAF